jgi:hypothetical protein
MFLMPLRLGHVASVAIAGICFALGCGAPHSAEPNLSSHVPEPPGAPTQAEDDEGQHARQLVGAAAELRTKRGACPGLEDVQNAYALGPATFSDRDGHPFTIACMDDTIRVSAGSREVAALMVRSRAAAIVESPAAPDAGATASPMDDAAWAMADKAMVAARGHFRRCYRLGLASNPSMSGTIHGSFEVLEDGTVGRVSLTGTGTLSKETVDCSARGVKTLVFASGRRGTVTLPFLD